MTCFPWHPACVHNPMAKIVAEQIVQLMLDARIERIYGVVGDALNPLTDAIRRSAKLRWIPIPSRGGSGVRCGRRRSADR